MHNDHDDHQRLKISHISSVGGSMGPLPEAVRWRSAGPRAALPQGPVDSPNVATCVHDVAACLVHEDPRCTRPASSMPGGSPIRKPHGVAQLGHVPSLQKCIRTGRWPDGSSVGRGHGQPYLMPTYAQALRDGRKTHEGRPGGGWLQPPGRRLIATGDYITFKVSGSREDRLRARVLDVQSFPTFEEMLKQVGVEALLPNFTGDLAAAVALYRSFANGRGSYGDLEDENGAIAMQLQLLGP